MTVDLQRVFESKRLKRQWLASHPIGEKLRMLDALRERELAIRGRSEHLGPLSGMVREAGTRFRVLPDK